MISATEAAKRKGCSVHAIIAAIERGDLAALKRESSARTEYFIEPAALEELTVAGKGRPRNRPADGQGEVSK